MLPCGSEKTFETLLRNQMPQNFSNVTFDSMEMNDGFMWKLWKKPDTAA